MDIIKHPRLPSRGHPQRRLLHARRVARRIGIFAPSTYHSTQNGLSLPETRFLQIHWPPERSSCRSPKPLGNERMADRKSRGRRDARAQDSTRRPARGRSGLLGGTGARARSPRNPSDGWAVCSREPSRTVGCCAPTDRSRPRRWIHCLRRSSASKGSIRMASTSALWDGTAAASAKSAATTRTRRASASVTAW